MENVIDLVIPMVFPDDPVWQQEYAHFCGHGTIAVNSCRYRSWGTEELLVRCCLKFMPWLRRIHILLSSSSQEQPWMQAMKRDGIVTTVCHRDFIPERYMPCFSSPCIEMFLKDIPGLSEQFIYANDDMFPLSPLEPSDFFRPAEPNGMLLPCQHVYEEPFPHPANLFQRKCMYQQNMVAKPFGRFFTTSWLRNGHSFAPILLSSCDAVWQRHGREILEHLSPRKRTDHTHNHYIYVLYQHFAGITIDASPRLQYVFGTGLQDLRDILAAKDAGIVCLNDNEALSDWQQRAAVLRAVLDDKLNYDR